MREVMKGSFDHNLDRILGFIRVTAKEGDNSLKLKKGIFPYYDEKMRPILEELGYTVESDESHVKISW